MIKTTKIKNSKNNTQNAKSMDAKAVDSLRILAATTVTNAGSGHPGMALGAAPIMYALYAHSMKYSSKRASYFNRDRLVLCAGHVSALQYSMLHAFGYNYSVEDLKSFRKLRAKCKGHPRYNPELGIDATSGPLGQGIPNGVGMAIAETMLAERFNKPNSKVIDHYTFVIASDGGLMEGISNEASSLAGTLKLSKLIVLYDSNNITMEADTSVSFTEDVLGRYKALGWNTHEVKDGNNVDSIVQAIELAKSQSNKPTIIKINTKIGHGSPHENTIGSHGTPLNADELELTKKKLGVTDRPFELNAEVKRHIVNISRAKEQAIEREVIGLQKYKTSHPEDYSELMKWLGDDYSKKIDWNMVLPELKDEATRKSSAKIINNIAKQVPNLVSGSADVAYSVGTFINDGGSYSATNRAGRNIHFGVREHAMAAICNGIALHGGLRVICSTFMVFSDYLRHALRLSAQMGLPIIYVFSHDSIAIGQDGATHQPIEYNTMHRATPGINFVRPADTKETLFGYKIAFEATKPTVLSLTRQNVKSLRNTGKNTERGGYIVHDSPDPKLLLIATGSEVELCVDASTELEKSGISTRVVSMPCVNIFDSQSSAYKDKILPPTIRKRVVVEMGSTLGWYKYAGLDGRVIGIDEFGQTGDGKALTSFYGFSKENIIKVSKGLLR